jgi:hypothetical protein
MPRPQPSPTPTTSWSALPNPTRQSCWRRTRRLRVEAAARPLGRPPPGLWPPRAHQQRGSRVPPWPQALAQPQQVRRANGIGCPRQWPQEPTRVLVLEQGGGWPVQPCSSACPAAAPPLASSDRSGCAAGGVNPALLGVGALGVVAAAVFAGGAGKKKKVRCAGCLGSGWWKLCTRYLESLNRTHYLDRSCAPGTWVLLHCPRQVHRFPLGHTVAFTACGQGLEFLTAAGREGVTPLIARPLCCMPQLPCYLPQPFTPRPAPDRMAWHQRRRRLPARRQRLPSRRPSPSPSQHWPPAPGW